MGTSPGELRWRLQKLDQHLDRTTADSSKVLATLAKDPAAIMTLAGLSADRWQMNVLRSRSRRTLCLCSRQCGKSTTAAALALLVAWLEAPALVLLLSPSMRQSTELFLKVKELNAALGCPVPPTTETVTKLELTNGSRIISLPGTEQTTRGYSGAALLVIDEAARVPDNLYRAVRPMLAVSGGALIALTTAWAKQGWFYSAWTSLTEQWERVQVKATECPRISAEFLREELTALGPRWYGMEYECQWADTVAGMFRPEDIDAAFDDTVQPLFVEDGNHVPPPTQ